jgi:HSP20 family molecular chaperone IbpA
MPKSNAEKQQAGGQQGSPQNTQSTEMQTSGRAGRQGGGMERRGAYAPSLFSLSPREFLSASPFELMRRFSEEMDRAFEGFGMSRGMGGGGEMMRWAPAVEVFERDNKLIVHAELPGLNKDDVRVELTDEGLVLQGERRREHEERNEGFYRSERSYGHFYRPKALIQSRCGRSSGTACWKLSCPCPKHRAAAAVSRLKRPVVRARKRRPPLAVAQATGKLSVHISRERPQAF